MKTESAGRQFPVQHLFFADHDGFHDVALLDRVDDILAFENLAKHRMLAVQPRSGDVGDEELRAVGVGAGVGHRQDAGCVVFEIGMKFVFKRVTRPASSRAIGAAALDHEVGDDAMKCEAVVKTVRGQLFEVRHGFGSFVVVQLNANRAAIGRKRGDLHAGSLCKALQRALVIAGPTSIFKLPSAAGLLFDPTVFDAEQLVREMFDILQMVRHM